MDQQLEREVLQLYDKRTQNFENQVQRKYQFQAKNLTQKLEIKMPQCINSGISKLECEQKYLCRTDYLVDVQQKFITCLQNGVFPANSNSKRLLQNCFDVLQKQTHELLSSYYQRVERLL